MDILPNPQIYHYTHSRGLIGLRRKISAYYKKQYGVNTDPESEIIITAGSKAAIYFAMMSILNPGDEAIIHEPTWVSFPEQVRLCHGKPIMMPYSCTVHDYEKYITEKTKLIIINNPHNPSGHVLKKTELEYLVALAKANQIYILADEAYSDFLGKDEFHSLGIFDREKSNIIICNSISKNFGISGWRLGYSIANSELTNQILKINQHVVTCPPSLLQYYMEAYFDKIIDITYPQIQELIIKRKEVARLLDAAEIPYLEGRATFYFFLSISPSKLTSEQFCDLLLHKEHVCTVPGKGYGDTCDSFIRLSFGSETISRTSIGIEKIKKLINLTS
jgi:aspartate aminotransferase/aminotransferase